MQKVLFFGAYLVADKIACVTVFCSLGKEEGAYLLVSSKQENSGSS